MILSAISIAHTHSIIDNVHSNNQELVLSVSAVYEMTKLLHSPNTAEFTALTKSTKKMPDCLLPQNDYYILGVE